MAKQNTTKLFGADQMSEDQKNIADFLGEENLIVDNNVNLEAEHYFEEEEETYLDMDSDNEQDNDRNQN
ncbi:MAG: hypothetical protein ACOVJ8_05060, partial [Sediminibacterium sp.]